MRGMADTGYAIKYFSSCGWKGIPLLLQCFEVHLLPFMVVNTLVVFPLYYKTVYHVPGEPLPFEVQYIEKAGTSTIVIGALILVLYEVIRNASCKHLYNKTTFFKWWDGSQYKLRSAFSHLMFISLLHRYFFPFYAMLLIAATPFILLPALYVMFKHVLNINSMNYYVAGKSVAQKSSS
jgi:hypothetical protein